MLANVKSDDRLYRTKLSLDFNLKNDEINLFDVCSEWK